MPAAGSEYANVISFERRFPTVTDLRPHFAEQVAARAAAMAAHPAGKGTPEFIKDWPVGNYSGDARQRPDAEQPNLRPQDNQRAVEELLRKVTAPPPRPYWEERIEELTAEFSAGLIEAFREALA